MLISVSHFAKNLDCPSSPTVLPAPANLNPFIPRV